MLAMVLSTTVNLSAQTDYLQKWVNKNEVNQNESSSKTKKAQTVVKDAGYLLEKSAKYQYAAIGFAGAGTAMALYGGIVGTKKYDPEKYSIDEINKKTESNRKLRKGLFIGSGISFAVAICCEFAAIDYKLKAGRSLKLFSTGTGGGLAYTF